MNKLFKRQGLPEKEPEVAPGSSVVLLNASTRTFGFSKKGKALPGIVPELTPDDRRKLAKRGYGNMVLMERAKQMYAAGYSIKEMADGLNISPDYAKGISSCFSHKKSVSVKKHI